MLGSGTSCNDELLAVKAQSYGVASCASSIISALSNRKKRDNTNALVANYGHFALCRSYDANNKNVYTAGAAASNYSTNNAGLSCPQNGDLILFSVPLKPPTYTITGTVKDATSTAVLSGVSVVVSTNPALTATTNANGQYSISGVERGNYSITFSRTTYITYQYTVEVIANKNHEDVFLSPTVSSNSLRAVTTWGPDGDLDTYLLIGDGSTCTVAFFNRNCACNDATLENDATEGYGPETMEIKNIAACNEVSSYYVAIWSIAVDSIANVKLYNSAGLIREFSRNTATFRSQVWKVFTVDNAGVITPVDEVTSSW